MGRPKKTLDEKGYRQLDNLIRLQCTAEEAAAVLEMDRDTLNRILKDDGNESFSAYSKRHAPAGKASLRRLQWKAAENGSVPMLIFLGKNWLGQKDNPDAATSEDIDRVIEVVRATRNKDDAASTD